MRRICGRGGTGDGSLSPDAVEKSLADNSGVVRGISWSGNTSSGNSSTSNVWSGGSWARTGRNPAELAAALTPGKADVVLCR
jgi:hypothetical protein